MAYAREVPAGAAATPAAEPAGQGAGADAAGDGLQPEQEGGAPTGPGPAESSGRLWVPGR